MAHLLSRTLPLLVLAALAAGCARESPAAERAPRRLFVIDGFESPESVRYDPEQDVYFVSAMMGPGSAKDGLGYIARVAGSDPRRVEIFIRGGAGGAVLDAPKGMAIQGDTLWAADIDVMRAFDRRTGAPLATLDLRPAGAVLLNDVAVGPDGALRVTDTGIAMTKIGVFHPGGDKILSIAGDGVVSVVAQGAELGRPNGITWDPEGERWIVVTFDPFHSQVYTLPPSGGARTVIASGKGRFDGVERLSDGRILITSWSDSALHVLDGDGMRPIIREIWQPADLGVDTRRGRVAIPLALQGRVEVWGL